MNPNMFKKCIGGHEIKVLNFIYREQLLAVDWVLFLNFVNA